VGTQTSASAPPQPVLRVSIGNGSLQFKILKQKHTPAVPPVQIWFCKGSKRGRYTQLSFVLLILDFGGLGGGRVLVVAGGGGGAAKFVV